MTLDEADIEAKRRWGQNAAAWYGFDGKIPCVGFPRPESESILPPPFLDHEVSFGKTFEAAFDRIDKSIEVHGKISEVVDKIHSLESELSLQKRLYTDIVRQATGQWIVLN